MKKRIISLLAMMLAVMIAFSACGGSQTLKMATGGTTGTYYAFGGLVAGVLESEVSGLKIVPHSSGASKANILEIEDGEADIALVQNDVAYYAYTGTDLFADLGAQTGFSVMAGAYAEVCQVVAASNITSIEDLAGKNVSVGDVGSGTEFNARQILEAYGITFDDITVSNLGFGDSADALKDGKIDAFFCVAGAPTTAIVELAASNDISLLGIDGEHARILSGNYSFYTTYTVPGGSYRGIDGDVQTVAVKAAFVVSNDLSEDIVYSMTKALFEKAGDIEHAKAEELAVENAVEGFSGLPFHPGAEKYFKEAGVM